MGTTSSDVPGAAYDADGKGRADAPKANSTATPGATDR
ncbi:hypothetical protein C5N14_20395 [Micromonospora sp. MW-13]|nr:hypothetical protein C5N14_20395 [Micromonospora sp. MW-13]